MRSASPRSRRPVGRAGVLPWLRGAALLLVALVPLIAGADSDTAYEAQAGDSPAEQSGPAVPPEPSDPVDWTALALALLNFAVLIAVLSRTAGPAVQAFFFQRSEGLRKQVEEAGARLRQAEIDRGELLRRLQGIEAECAWLLARLAEQAAAERELARLRTAQAERRIEAEAERTALREIARVRTALRAETAALTVELAERILRQQARPEDHDRRVEHLIAQLERHEL